MGSLIDELQRREAAARAGAEELRGRIAELAEQLAQAEERLSRLVIARETVEEVLDSAATEIAPVLPAAQQPEGTALPGPGRSPVVGVHGWLSGAVILPGLLFLAFAPLVPASPKADHMRRSELERELGVYSHPAQRRLAIQAMALHDHRFPITGRY